MIMPENALQSSTIPAPPAAPAGNPLIASPELAEEFGRFVGNLWHTGLINDAQVSKITDAVAAELVTPYPDHDESTDEQDARFRAFSGGVSRGRIGAAA